MNGDSSIRERIAQRDARVARARELLRRARTEQERADAVCEELDAKIECDRAMWGRALGPTPAIAAMVMLGRLSIADAVHSALANTGSIFSMLDREFCAILSPADWLAFEAIEGASWVLRGDRTKRAVDERDLDGVAVLLDTAPLDSRSVAAAALGLGRDFVSRHRDSARSAIANIESERNATWSRIEQLAQLSYALELSEQRALLLRLTQRIARPQRANADPSTEQEAHAALALALLSIGEPTAATPSIENVLFAHDSLIGRYHRDEEPLLFALRRYSSAERYAQWEERVRQRVERDRFANVAELLVAPGVSEPWRGEIAQQFQRQFDAGRSFHGPIEALSPGQQRDYFRALLRASTERRSQRALRARVEADPAFEEELLAGAPTRTSSAHKRGEGSELIAILLDAAKSNDAADEALRAWLDPREIVECPGFCQRVRRETVAVLLDRARSEAEVPEGTRAAARRVIASASAEAAARWSAQLRAITPASEAREQEAHLARLRAAREWLDEGASARLDASMVEEIRALPGGDAALLRLARKRLAAARANAWQLDDELAEIEASLVASYDLDAIAMLSDRADVPQRVAYRVVVRCAALLRQSSVAHPAAKSVRIRLANECLERGVYEWERIVVTVFGLETPGGLVAAVGARPLSFAPMSRSFVPDCVELGIVDEVLRILERGERGAALLRNVTKLLPHAGPEARERAVKLARALFRESDNLPSEAEIPWLAVEDIVDRWDTIAEHGSERLMNPPLLAKLGGRALVDRIAESLLLLLVSESNGLAQ